MDIAKKYRKKIMNLFIDEVRKSLARKPDAHKGDFGHLLIIGGDYGMGGAIIMAAEAACRAGVGKVTVLTREENFSPLLARLANVMTVSSDAGAMKILANKTAIVIGCGLGKSAWAQDLFEMAMSSNLPKIIDADALNILSESEKKYDLSNSIITPHVGEASRLLALSTNEIQNDREIAAKKLHEKYAATVVLKGRGSLVFGDSKIMHKSIYGNAGMAVAGMGDVLSGIIGALKAQKLDNEKSAFYAVNIHGFAGDLVAKKRGEIGMMPRDLFKYILQIINGKIT